MELEWKCINDVEISGSAVASQSFSIDSDTIYIDSVAVTSTDSLIINISKVTSPSNAGYTDFTVSTALNGGIPIAVSPLPRINILKVVPIVDVHVNDASGVPASPYGIGSSVTISGIITADFNTARTDIYVQDSTAGINILAIQDITIIKLETVLLLQVPSNNLED